MSLAHRMPLPVAGVAALVLLAAPLPAAAQDQNGGPLTNSVLAGAAGIMYMAPSDSLGHGMTMVTFMPTFLVSLGRDMLFEGEVHFTPAGEGAETEIEYAQLDYQRFDHFQVIAGQFLLPLGVFGERLHMAWINEMPDLPLLYSDDPVSEGTLMSLPSDFGAMVRYANSMTNKLDLNVSLYATQGPHMVAGTPAPGEIGPPDVALGNTIKDMNGNKLIGARVGVIGAPGFEVYASGFVSKYDTSGQLSYNAANLAAIWRPLGAKVLGEWAHVWQQYDDAGQIRTLGRAAYFVQLTRRFGNVEPALRWDQLLAGKAGGATIQEGKHRFTLGVDYWLDTTIPVKLAYEFNSVGTDQVIVQWVFGF